MSGLRLGLFHIKNDDVLLLTGSKADIGRLADQLEGTLSNHIFTLPLHDHVTVSKRHPAKLYVSSELMPTLEANEFWWRCTNSDIRKLRKITDNQFDCFISLSRPSDLFQVSSHVYYYNDDWWRTYG
jgi:hypothetical protein